MSPLWLLIVLIVVIGLWGWLSDRRQSRLLNEASKNGVMAGRSLAFADWLDERAKLIAERNRLRRMLENQRTATKEGPP